MVVDMNEDTCEQCNGTGTIGPFVTFDNILEDYKDKDWSFLEMAREWIRLPKDGDVFKRRCSKCLGSGQLDWIEKVVGKRLENIKAE